MNKLKNYIKPLFIFLNSLPRGKITTYSIAAKAIGLRNPRNIGWLLKQNNDPDNIPCYKVVRSNGSLAIGYKFGGMEEQRKRLEQEGIIFNQNNTITDFKKLIE